MPKGIFAGVGNKARKVKNLYVGIGNKARKVKAAYVGVNGLARKWWPAIALDSPPSEWGPPVVVAASGSRTLGSGAYIFWLRGSGGNGGTSYKEGYGTNCSCWKEECECDDDDHCDCWCEDERCSGFVTTFINHGGYGGHGVVNQFLLELSSAVTATITIGAAAPVYYNQNGNASTIKIGGVTYTAAGGVRGGNATRTYAGTSGNRPAITIPHSSLNNYGNGGNYDASGQAGVLGIFGPF